MLTKRFCGRDDRVCISMCEALVSLQLLSYSFWAPWQNPVSVPRQGLPSNGVTQNPNAVGVTSSIKQTDNTTGRGWMELNAIINGIWRYEQRKTRKFQRVQLLGL